MEALKLLHPYLFWPCNLYKHIFHIASILTEHSPNKFERFVTCTHNMLIDCLRALINQPPTKLNFRKMTHMPLLFICI